MDARLKFLAKKQALTDAFKNRKPDPFDKHFTVKELAVVWGVSASTIRTIFQDVPGVFRIGKSSRRDGKRDYVTLRIPESLAKLVRQREYREWD